MAFKKAEATKRWARVQTYGPAGSGKTRTLMLLAQEFSDRLKAAGKPHRIAVVDTEHQRSESEVLIGFDFDVEHCCGFAEMAAAVEAFDPTVYGALVVDSLSPPWDSIQDAQGIIKTKIGTTRFDQWRKIKTPWREFIAQLGGLDAHVLLTARQGTEYKTTVDENGQENMTAVGFKAKAENETAYEAGTLLRMEVVKQQMGPEEFGLHKAFVEKCDAPGLVHSVFSFRKNDSIEDDQAAVAKAFAPLFETFTGRNGETKQPSPLPSDAVHNDGLLLAERDAQAEQNEKTSEELLLVYTVRIKQAESKDALQAIWKEAGADKKAKRIMPQAYTQLSTLKDQRKAELERTVSDES